MRAQCLVLKGLLRIWSRHSFCETVVDFSMLASLRVTGGDFVCLGYIFGGSRNTFERMVAKAEIVLELRCQPFSYLFDRIFLVSGLRTVPILVLLMSDRSRLHNATFHFARATLCVLCGREIAIFPGHPAHFHCVCATRSLCIRSLSLARCLRFHLACATSCRL